MERNKLHLGYSSDWLSKTAYACIKDAYARYHIAILGNRIARKFEYRSRERAALYEYIAYETDIGLSGLNTAPYMALRGVAEMALENLELNHDETEAMKHAAQNSTDNDTPIFDLAFFHKVNSRAYFQAEILAYNIFGESEVEQYKGDSWRLFLPGSIVQQSESLLWYENLRISHELYPHRTVSMIQEKYGDDHKVEIDSKIKDFFEDCWKTHNSNAVLVALHL